MSITKNTLISSVRKMSSKKLSIYLVVKNFQKALYIYKYIYIYDIYIYIHIHIYIYTYIHGTKNEVFY